MRGERLIRDPVYGYIALADELAAVVDHPLFQRLRRVGQTSLTHVVYPAATGSRFEHALGAAHLAARGWRAAWRTTKVRDVFLAVVGDEHPTMPRDPNGFAAIVESATACVALLHDIGHPPFSHVLEPLYEELTRAAFASDPDDDVGVITHGPFHEAAGVHLMRRLVTTLPEPLAAVTRQVYETDPDLETWAGALHSIVASEVDVDRLDYLMRDGQKAGTEFGAIDYERLVDALELHATEHGFKVAPGVRARSAVETLLVQRTQAYKWITFHPRVVGGNLALLRALERFLSIREAGASFYDHVVTISDVNRPLRDLFGPLRPNLEYLWPGRQELALAIRGMPDEPGSAGEQGMDIVEQLVMDQGDAELLDELRSEIQAGVDDGAVTEALKRASLVARTLLAEPTIAMRPEVRASLTRLVTYVQAALFRSKNYLAIWKTVEEFSGIVDGLMGDIGRLPDIVNEIFDEVGRDARLPQGADWLTAELATVQALLADDAVAGVNHVIRTLLSEETARRRLMQQLSAVRSNFLNHAGFWDIAYTGFQPVRTGNNLTVLFRDEQQRALLETSPLAQALERVEDNRSKIFLYFFIEHPHQISDLDPRQVRKEREALATTFIGAFPRFVRTAWPTLLRTRLVTQT